MSQDPTVFIVDDDEDIRAILRSLADSVGFPSRAFESAQSFLESYDKSTPGCLVLDVRMRGMSGLDLLEEMRAIGIDLPVIMLTGFGDVALAVRAMRAGALDFLEKPFREQELLDRIQEGINLDTHQRRQNAARQEILTRLDTLTPREREVVGWVVSGKTNKEIAAILGISLRAVESHRARAMERMKAGSVAELVRYMIIADPSLASMEPDPILAAVLR